MREVRVLGVPRAARGVKWRRSVLTLYQTSDYRLIYIFVLYFYAGFYFDQPEFRDRIEERICQLYK